jgi:uncharacterized membrane protein
VQVRRAFGAIEKAGIDKRFQQDVRDMLQPGTSALFLVVDKITPDKATEALSKFGGRVLKTSLTKDAEEQLQEALHGSDHRRRDPVEAGPAPAGVS